MSKAELIAVQAAGRELPRNCARLLAIAERDPRRAVLLVQRYLAQGRIMGTWAQFTLGWAFLRWERAPEALAQLQIAQAAFVAQGNPAAAHDCQLGLLQARQLIGEGAGLQEEWAALVAACSAAGRHPEAARARCEQVAHLNVLSRPAEAYALARYNAPFIARYGTIADQARHHQVAGVAASSCGELAIAGAELERAYTIFSRLRRPLDQARVLFDRSWLAQRHERLDLARTDLSTALSVFRRFDMPLRIALCEKDLGIVASYAGDYAAGIAWALKARAQFEALGRRDLVARCDLNLGTIAHYSGLADLALATYQSAGEIFAAAGARRLELICRRNQALLLSTLQPAAALELLDSIEQQVVIEGDQIEHAELQAVRAATLRRLGAPIPAQAHFEAARRQFLALGNSIAAAECQIELGWLHLAEGRPPDAAICFYEADTLLGERPALRWRALYGLGRITALQGDKATALQYFLATGELVAGIRRKLASEHASSAIFDQARQFYQEALQLALQEGAYEQLLALAEQQRTLALQRQMAGALPPSPELQERRDRLRDQLRDLRARRAAPETLDATLRDYVATLLHTRHHQPRADTPHAPFDLALLRQRLSSTYAGAWSVLLPLFVSDELLLITLTPDAILLNRQPYDTELRRLLAQARLPNERQMVYRNLAGLRDTPGTDWHVLCALAGRLLPAPLLERLQPLHRLFIVPSGPLHALPWAALRYGEAWLCERAIIEYLPALGLLPSSEVNPDRHKRALLIGCTRFDGRAPDLPCARASLDQAEAFWPGPVRRLEDAQATRTALLELSHSGELHYYRLIQIASHAYAGASRGLLGHIKLAEDDLFVDEVLTLRLHNALVVLAICAGAASEVLPGDEVLSLQHAFLAAGAEAVLASLWPIRDQSTLAILEHFYTALSCDNDPAAALAVAQRRLIALPEQDNLHNEMMRSPFVWGSFTITRAGAPDRP